MFRSNQNLYPSLQNSDGSPPSDLFSVNMGPLSSISSLLLGIDTVSYIEVVGQTAYVAGLNGLYRIDIADQYNPEITGSLAYSYAPQPYFRLSGLYVDGKYAYVLLKLFNPLMVMYDISSSSGITLFDTINLPKTKFAGIWVSNSNMTVLMGNSIVTHNISNPLSITNTTAPFFIGSEVYGINTIEGLNYVFGVGQVVVLSSTTNPIPVATISCPTNAKANNPVTAVVGNDEILLVGTENYLFYF